MSKTAVKIIETEHHRNGIGGEGFTLVKFTYHSLAPGTFLAIIPDSYRYSPEEHSNTACFVVNIDLLPDIEFGINSWRGDRTYSDLRNAGLWAEDRFVIANEPTSLLDDNTLYWSNENGWVDLDSATKFTLTERRRFVPTVNGYWVHTEMI